jgi:hypothetical protein
MPAAKNPDPVTGMSKTSQSHKIAVELIRGGVSRKDIAEKLRAKLPAKSEFGNPNPIDQKIHSVVERLLDKGFVIESWYQLVPPEQAATAKRQITPPKPVVKKVTKPAARKTAPKTGVAKTGKKAVKKVIKRGRRRQVA